MKTVLRFPALFLCIIFFLFADSIFAQYKPLKKYRSYKAPDVTARLTCPVVNVQASPVVSPKPANPNSASTLTVIPLGTSANGLGWGYAGGQRTHIWADDKLKTLALIHRMGPGGSPSNLSGYLAVDKAVNMGHSYTDWVMNWQVYASNLYSGGNYLDMAGNPQLGIVNPAGNTDPENSYIHYFTSLQPATPSSPGNYAHGRVKWNSQPDSTKRFNWFNPPPYHGNPDGFFISQTNKAYTVDVDINPVTNTYNNQLIVGVGTLNSVTHDFDYVYSALPLFGNLGTVPLRPRIAADPTGQHVWIACIGNNGQATPVFDSTYYPIFFHSTDAGQTWSNPIAVTLDSPNGIPAVLNFISDYRLDSIYYPDDPPPRDQISFTTAFDCDLVVDKWGRPHIGVGIHLAGGGFSVTVIDSAFAIFDIIGCDMGTIWCGRVVGWPKQFRGYFPASPDIFEDNRVNASVNTSGNKVFFTWLDSQSSFDTANDHPDVFARGFDMILDKFTNSYGKDQGTNITNSSSLAGSAWFADASYYTFSKPDGSFLIPILTESVNGGNILANPVSFNYISNFTYAQNQYTINSQGPPWGDMCYCYWGIEDKSNEHSSLLVAVNPNPAKSSTEFQVQTTEKGNISIVLSSVSGQSVAYKQCHFNEPGSHTVSLDVSHLSPGIYFYTVSLGAQTASGKLVVE